MNPRFEAGIPDFMNGILNFSIHFNVVHRKVDWQNPKMKSLNSMPASIYSKLVKCMQQPCKVVGSWDNGIYLVESERWYGHVSQILCLCPKRRNTCVRVCRRVTLDFTAVSIVSIFTHVACIPLALRQA